MKKRRLTQLMRIADAAYQRDLAALARPLSRQELLRAEIDALHDQVLPQQDEDSDEQFSKGLATSQWQEWSQRKTMDLQQKVAAIEPELIALRKVAATSHGKVEAIKMLKKRAHQNAVEQVCKSEERDRIPVPPRSQTE